MHLFHRRYLTLYCAFFAVACLGGCFFHGVIKLATILALLGGALLFLVLLIVFKTKRARFLNALLCLTFAAVALIQSFYTFDRVKTKTDPLIGTAVQTLITVEAKNYLTDYSASYDVSFSHNGDTFRALLLCDFPADLSLGDTLLATVTVETIEEHKEILNSFYADSIYVCLIPTEDRLGAVQSGNTSLKTALHSLNLYLSDVFGKLVGGDEAALLSALILGNDDILASNVQRDFQRTGTSHILAISGMHLTVIMIALEAVLRRTRMPKGARCAVVFAIALFYLALTGFALSTLRAFLMMSMVYIAYMFHADNDAVTSLFFSLFLILATSPTAVWDIGLWLSFLAVLGILMGNVLTAYFTEKLHKTKLKKRAVKALAMLLSAVITTVSANVFICLPMWLFFSELSLMTLPANLLVSPLISVIMYVAPLLLWVSHVPFLSAIPTLLSHFLRAVCHATVTLISALSAPRGITLSLEYDFVGYIAVPTAILLALTLILPLKRKALILLIPSVAAIAFFGSVMIHNATNANRLTADYLSFGESEMLVLTTAKDTVICDMSTGANAMLYDAIAFSKDRFSTEVSALVLTHYHTYHINSFVKNASRFMIRRLYLPIPQTQNEYYRMSAMLQAAERVGVDVTLFDRNSNFCPAENVTVNLSSLAYLSRSTHPTFVLTVSAFDKQLTYVAESAHESDELSKEVALRLENSELVIFGAHGPITKTDFAYDSLSGLHQVVISDPAILSHFDPQRVRNIITESSVVTYRMEE